MPKQQVEHDVSPGSYGSPAAAPVLVEVTLEPLQLSTYCDFVAHPGAGAVVTFSGVTRDNFQGKRVLKLEYEAYAPMAEKVMQVGRAAHR